MLQWLRGVVLRAAPTDTDDGVVSIADSFFERATRVVGEETVKFLSLGRFDRDVEEVSTRMFVNAAPFFVRRDRDVFIADGMRCFVTEMNNLVATVLHHAT